MAIFSPAGFDARRDGDAPAHDHITRPTDRVLGVLEAWIDMRTRRERARLDAVISGTPHAEGPEMYARTAWWRSWRARTRRRG